MHTPFTFKHRLPILVSLSSLLGEFHSENEMLEAPAVHLVARLDGIVPVRKADEGKALGQASITILGQEDSSDAAEPLEHISQLLLLGHL